jgi:hypothetical protein
VFAMMRRRLFSEPRARFTREEDGRTASICLAGNRLFVASAAEI